MIEERSVLAAPREKPPATSVIEKAAGGLVNPSAREVSGVNKSHPGRALRH